MFYESVLGVCVTEQLVTVQQIVDGVSDHIDDCLTIIHTLEHPHGDSAHRG